MSGHTKPTPAAKRQKISHVQVENGMFSPRPSTVPVTLTPSYNHAVNKRPVIGQEASKPIDIPQKSESTKDVRKQTNRAHTANPQEVGRKKTSTSQSSTVYPSYLSFLMK